MNRQSTVLTVIVLAQFCCTSLWFAGNGIMSELIAAFHLGNQALGHLTSAVQLGFILGTLTFAIFTVADKFSPSKVFLFSALIASGINLLMLLGQHSIYTLVGVRFGTGFFLAGIYPVGMKIAADYFKEGLGLSLGYLVGALVLGTAFPHFIKAASLGYDWTWVIIATSTLAALGGIVIYLWVPDGPYRRSATAFNPSIFYRVFENKEFRSAAFGYFGHMWELYAFWAFVPFALAEFVKSDASGSWLSFAIIGIGGVACVIGGYISVKHGAARVAMWALVISGVCCLISPWVFQFLPNGGITAFLLLWGMAVIADSPQFSTLVAHNADAENKGTALTIVNCLGFAITIVSIQLLSWAQEAFPSVYLFLILAPGPTFGLLALRTSK